MLCSLSQDIVCKQVGSVLEKGFQRMELHYQCILAWQNKDRGDGATVRLKILGETARVEINF